MPGPGALSSTSWCAQPVPEMKLAHIFTALGPIDLKNLRRDPLLVWLPVIPLLPALLARWGIPPLAAWLEADFGFDLVPYYPLLMSFLAVLTPSFAGMITGFLLLDERDDHTLTALLVTPLPLNGYVAYRLGAPLLLGGLMTLLVLPVAGLIALPFGQTVAVVLLAGLIAPLLALFLAAFAENKVVGFALMKSLNGILMLPVLAYFLPGAWQWLGGLAPTFWPLKAYWLAAEGSAAFWPAVVVGTAVNLAAVYLLLRRFQRVLHR
jgi:fluoroquinolone transport system permease protein